MQADLKALKKDLKREFSHITGLEGFGIGSDHLVAYVVNEDAARTLPETYRGVNLQRVITGDVEAQSALVTATALKGHQ